MNWIGLVCRAISTIWLALSCPDVFQLDGIHRLYLYLPKLNRNYSEVMFLCAMLMASCNAMLCDVKKGGGWSVMR